MVSMAAQYGISFRGFTIDLLIGSNFPSEAGVGGDLRIRPDGEHPGLYIGVYLLLIWFRLSIFYCDHDHSSPAQYEDFE